MPIRRLPTLLVNQIAAGEVIERPANVVKELVENALDAGATQIDVAIENGGGDLIRVTDDGGGISRDELHLAVAPHATSKIAEADDLEAIGTLGFRGEALASIASVSRLSMTSRPQTQDEAWIIETEGDRVEDPRPAGSPPGTTVTVRNLFFNTPARRKFLKTDSTEATRCAEMVRRLAMAHPRVGFALRNNGRLVIDLPREQAAVERVRDLLGREVADHLLEVTFDDPSLAIWGLVGAPDVARNTSRSLWLFLNGRWIMDRAVVHAVKEAYRGLIEPGRFPTAAVFLEIEPTLVDVNVHPTKSEVRFRQSGQVHAAVRRAIRAALQDADLTPGIDLSRSTEPSMMPFSPTPGSGGAGSASTSEFVDYFRRLDPQQKGFVYSEVKQALATESPELLLADPPPTPTAPEVLPTVRTAQDVLQVHSSFIVTQDEQGLLIIDQHALHERVMFERLRNDVTKGHLESQRLLMPATVEADTTQMEVFEELGTLLERIGIDAAAMGPRAIAVHAFPSLLFDRGVDPIAFMSDLLRRAVEDGFGNDPEAALHETLDMMACKAAIKAGDRLTDAEIADLLRQRETVERSSNCPHGRPTTLRLTIRDLERQFGRG